MEKINLSNQAILVELNIRVPSFRKLDKKVTREVTVSKGADDQAGRFNKSLLAGADQLDKIQKFVASTRVEFYAKTLPWSDSGQRLADIRSFLSVKDWLNDKSAEYDKLATDFVAIYPNLVSAQAFKMGTMFDRSEYPDANDIARRFGFNFYFTPLPEQGDFRVDVGHDIATELQAEYEKVYGDRTKQAMEDLWNRLYKVTKHLSERFADNEKGDSKRLFDSVLDNALELCEMLSVMNVTHDSDLDWARQKLEEALHGVDMKDVRDSKGLRKEVKARVDELADKLGW
jgi:hypothetical protein